jgi:hypothetical protein
LNLLSLENRKFGSTPCEADPIWFSKNQEKTSGTLYSVFKEPDPEGCAHRDTPFFRRSQLSTSASRRKFQFPKIFGFVKGEFPKVLDGQASASLDDTL